MFLRIGVFLNIYIYMYTVYTCKRINNHNLNHNHRRVLVLYQSLPWKNTIDGANPSLKKMQ